MAQYIQACWKGGGQGWGSCPPDFGRSEGAAGQRRRAALLPAPLDFWPLVHPWSLLPKMILLFLFEMSFSVEMASEVITSCLFTENWEVDFDAFRPMEYHNHKRKRRAAAGNMDCQVSKAAPSRQELGIILEEINLFFWKKSPKLIFLDEKKNHEDPNGSWLF